MATILLAVGSIIAYLIAYYTYGRYLSRKIFKLDPAAKTPAHALRDDVDYVPAHQSVLFGHHYTSIAGTGPIVGPAIGIIWGWVPALIWVLVGSIFMGAVHDFGSIVVSMRHQGKSISECASHFLGVRVKYIFFCIIFLLLLIVIAIFGVVIAAVFARFPQSVFPVWMEIPIAIAMGWGMYKKKLPIVAGTVAAVTIMYITVYLGHLEAFSFTLPALAFLPPTGAWVIILLIYAFIASTLPVTVLLQPRDYINAWQIFVAMGLLMAGLLVSGFSGQLHIVAPAFNLHPQGAPPLFPFLFITIACGAISGFHCLVGSGTSSKQIQNESHAQFIGYGSMLLEGFLAVLVICAVAAGIGMAYEVDGNTLTGAAAWQHHYSSWSASQGLGSKITAVVVGSANMIESIGIPRSLGIVIMGVFIASFAGTTLDTATRLQRYIVTELFGGLNICSLTGRYTATAFAVISAGILAFATGANGTGALTLWPLFGALNQLLGALALLVITSYLAHKGGAGTLLTGIPCIIMCVVTLWAVIINEINFINSGSWLLAVINILVLILSLWMIVEGAIVILGVRGKRP